MHSIPKKPIDWYENKTINVAEIDFAEHAPFCGSFFNVNPGAESPVDQHEVLEVWLVISGAGELFVGDSTEAKSIQMGDVVKFDSFETHRVKNNSNEVLKMISLWWKP